VAQQPRAACVELKRVEEIETGGTGNALINLRIA
jgi:hypothetical protein